MITMSTPLNVLLTHAMVDALRFVTTKVLGEKEELIGAWVFERKMKSFAPKMAVAKSGAEQRMS